MAKVLKIALVVAAIAVNVIPRVGQGVSAGLFGAAFGATATGAAIGALLTSVALASPEACLFTTSFTGTPLIPSQRRGRHSGVSIRAKRQRRYRLFRTTGGCLEPILEEGDVVVADSHGALRVGDLVAFAHSDAPRGSHLIKRFMGFNDQREYEVQTLFPVDSFFVPEAKILWMHRIRAVSRPLSAFRRAALLLKVARNPYAFNEKLGFRGVVPPDMPEAT